MFVVVWCPRRSVALTEDQSSSTSPPSGFISITDFTPTPHSEMADGAPVAITADHLQQLLTQLQQQNAALREELNDMRNQGTHVAGFISAAVQQTLQQTEGVVGGPNGAAVRLGLCRTTLISKMKRLRISLEKISVAVPAVASVPTPRTSPLRAIARSGANSGNSNPHPEGGRTYAVAEA